MKSIRIRSTALLTATLSIAVLGVAAPASAATTKTYPVNTNPGYRLNVRSGPGENFPIVQKLDRGDRVRIECVAWDRGGRLWDRISTGRWAIDAKIKTGSNEAVAPPCDSPSSLFDDPTLPDDVWSAIEDTRAHGGYDNTVAWAEADFGGGRVYRVAVQCDVTFRGDYWTYGEIVDRGVSRADCGGGHTAHNAWVQWRFPTGSTPVTKGQGL